jgi:NAD(P)-dependent dehydrogenase (short-subunit alcohol dehydrogenase family)
LLIGNAGIMACPYSKTKDGFESQFGVNHVAHFLLVTSLLPELKAGKPARVIMVSSVLNKFQGINFDDINWEKNYDKWSAYGQSKTANILFALQLNKLYMSEGVQAFALNPGAIMTNLQNVLSIDEQRSMGYFKEDGTIADFFKTVEQGASTSVYAAVAPELDGSDGEYLEDCAITRVVNENKTDFRGRSPHAADMKAAERLWALSEEMIAVK